MENRSEHSRDSLQGRIADVLKRLESSGLAEPERVEFTRELRGLRDQLGADPLTPTAVELQRDSRPSEVELADDLRVAVKPASAPSAELIGRLTAHAPKESRYQILGEIARGGMGAVLKAFDTDLRRSLAMKVALERGRNDKKQRERTARFLEEAQITGQLDHPGIVPVHELGLDSSGRLYFTMRLVRGRDLSAIYELASKDQEGWSTTRVLGVLLKVCEALAYAHSKGVIHRDLKPANVMVGRFGEVYVMDWGLAKVIGRPDTHDLRIPRDSPSSAVSGVDAVRSAARMIDPTTSLVTLDGTVLGTPCYMSPEQARGEIEVMDARSDTFSLGAMLYHLLTHTPPYCEHEKTIDARQIWMRMLAGPPTPVAKLAPEAPAELVAVCERAMAHSPQARYSSVLDLADDLRAFLENRVVHAYETGAWAELRKWVRRNRLASSAAAALLVGTVGGTLAFAIHAQNARTQLRLTADESMAESLFAQGAQVLRFDPEYRAAMDRWLVDADDLMTREAIHTGRLARAGIEPALAGDADRRANQFRIAFDRLRGRDGLIQRVRAHVRAMDEIGDSSLRSDQARARWSEAIRVIADRPACPAYDGLQIRPQFGLLPIGRAPVSGLWEFAYLPTGTVPARDPTTGLLVVEDASALVFVLLPAGTAVLPPAQAPPDAPSSAPGSGPRQVAVGAFFLSKYEMTQAQWLRLTGENPSRIQPGTIPAFERSTYEAAGLHPVEMLSALDCEAALAPVALRLPTDAEWEWSANKGDRSDAPPPPAEIPSHVPVHKAPPNGRGIHGLRSNALEWCREVPHEETASDAPQAYILRGDPRPPNVEDRGGPPRGRGEFGRDQMRGKELPRERNPRFGVRPARSLDGAR